MKKKKQFWVFFTQNANRGSNARYRFLTWLIRFGVLKPSTFPPCEIFDEHLLQKAGKLRSLLQTQQSSPTQLTHCLFSNTGMVYIRLLTTHVHPVKTRAFDLPTSTELTSQHWALILALFLIISNLSLWCHNSWYWFVWRGELASPWKGDQGSSDQEGKPPQGGRTNARNAERQFIWSRKKK